MFGFETIYSNFTPIVKSPVIGYRISGKSVLEILSRLTKRDFKNDHSKSLYLKIFDIDGSIIDICSVIFFKSPKSFTGEDLCEIFLHGSPLIASQFERILKNYKISGLRLARKGEFTYRSVLNKKNTLKQAQAINFIINNESFSSLNYNKKLLFEGDAVSGLFPLRDGFINLYSEVTAFIDFVDDENLDFKKIKRKIKSLFQNCNKLLLENKRKVEQKDLCKVMLIGPVNVGKSTLFNKIIDKDRAIVTDIKGTTRDILINNVIINGRKFEIYDTAGQRFKQGKIERYGYKKAQNLSKNIDHFLILTDKNTKKSDLQFLYKDFSINKNSTLIETKSDKYKYNSKNIKIHYNLNRNTLLSRIKLISIHKKYVVNNVKKIDFNENELEFLKNLIAYEKDIINETDILIIAQLIRNILDDFSYEFGYINNEDIYDKVFSNFCIGK